MGATNMERFERVLMAIGTKGVAEKPAAVAHLNELVEALEPAHRAGATEVLQRFAAANDFVTLWSELQSFAPFLEFLAPSPVTAELPEVEEVEPPLAPQTRLEKPVEVSPQPVSAASLLPPMQAMDNFRWDAPPLPEEMLADFFAEVAEHLDEVSQLVLSVREAEDPDMYELYRKLHTVKGNSGMVGLNELQEVAHGMEDVVKELRSRGEAPTDALRKVLADGAQLASTILRLAEEGGTGQLPVSIYTDRLRTALAGGTPVAEPTTEAPVELAPLVSPPPLASPPPGPVLATSETPPTDPAPPPSNAGEGASRPASSGKRMLRVDFAQVDQLAALVGEQAVRQEEVGKHIERLEEGVDELHRQLKSGNLSAAEAQRQAVAQAREVSKDLGGILSGLEGTSQALDLVSTDIQRTVLNLRMTPLEALFSKHRMTVFQAASAQGKKAKLVVEAGEAKLDKSLAEKLEEPLIHLIRNAVSHGIQVPEDRVKVGKPEEGTVTIRAFHQGNQVVVQVEDDGVGLAADVIRRKAVEKGFLTEEESLKVDDRRIVDMIFAAGFSTTTVVDDVSGRGVGLDVVRDKINRINGAVEIISEPGKGTVFQLTLPLTLALARVLLAEVAGEMTALPADAVLRVETLSVDSIVTVEGRKMVRLEDETLPLINLSRTLGLSAMAHRPNELVAAITTFGNQRAALAVDRVLLPTQAVVREVGPVMPAIRHCMGVTFHEGRCVLIVDIGSVLRDWTGDPTLREPESLEGFHAIVTREPSRFFGLARPSREAEVDIALVHPDRLDSGSLNQLGSVYLDGALTDLEAVAERCAGRGPTTAMIVLAAGEELLGRSLDRLYTAGAEDVWPLDQGWDVLIRRFRRGGVTGGSP
jgi:two-component system, chemotaxis family, sensor kinase CheA